MQTKALELVTEQAQLIRRGKEKGLTIKTVGVDLYDAAAKEILWFGDGICVSEQKAKRDCQAKKGRERVTTEMAMLEKKDGSYRTIIAGEGINRVELYQAESGAGIWRTSEATGSRGNHGWSAELEKRSERSVRKRSETYS